jgi:hypothetical protein
MKKQLLASIAALFADASLASIAALFATASLVSIAALFAAASSLHAQSGWGIPSMSLSGTTPASSSYTAAPGDLVMLTATASSDAVTLPNAPYDRTRVAAKLVAVSGTYDAVIATSGSDTFNTAGGSTSLTLSLVNQAINLQYVAATKVWVVVGDDLPLADADARYPRQSGTYLGMTVGTSGTAGYASTSGSAAVSGTAGYAALSGTAGYAYASGTAGYAALSGTANALSTALQNGTFPGMSVGGVTGPVAGSQVTGTVPISAGLASIAPLISKTSTTLGTGTNITLCSGSSIVTEANITLTGTGTYSISLSSTACQVGQLAMVNINWAAGQSAEFQVFNSTPGGVKLFDYANPSSNAASATLWFAWSGSVWVKASWASNNVTQLYAASIPQNGLVLQVEADFLGLTNSSALASWPDVSGQGNNLYQRASVSQPIFISGTTPSGRAALLYSGSQYMIGPPIISGTGGKAIFVVWRSNISNPTAQLAGQIGFPRGGSEWFSLESRGNANPYLRGDGADLGAASTSSTTWQLVEGTFTGGSGGTARTYRNGVQQATGTESYNTVATGNFYTGTNVDAPDFINGYVAAIVVYNRWVTDAERAQIEAYLDARYTLY